MNNIRKLLVALSLSVLASVLIPIRTERADKQIMVATKEPNDITEISTAYFETKEQEIETEQKYTNEELEIMAHVMNGEAGNVKNDEWVLYYGSVVLNRVKHPQFPNTIKEVVFQRNPLQYACTIDGNYDRQPPQRMYDLAKRLLESGSIIPENVIFQATFKQGKIWKKCGNTYFCYGKD